MSDTTELECIILDLIEMRLLRGDEVFIFSSGELRGKLKQVQIKDCIPAATYLSVSQRNAKQIPCLVLTQVPRQKDPTKKAVFTRAPVFFAIPMSIAYDAVKIVKIEDGKWMLNIDTKIKPATVTI